MTGPPPALRGTAPRPLRPTAPRPARPGPCAPPHRSLGRPGEWALSPRIDGRPAASESGAPPCAHRSHRSPPDARRPGTASPAHSRAGSGTKAPAPPAQCRPSPQPPAFRKSSDLTAAFRCACQWRASRATRPGQSAIPDQGARICLPRHWPSFPGWAWPRPAPPARRKSLCAAPPCRGHCTERPLPACSCCRVPHRPRSAPTPEMAGTAPTAPPPQAAPAPWPASARPGGVRSRSHRNAIPQAVRQNAPRPASGNPPSARFPATGPALAAPPAGIRQPLPDRLPSCPTLSHPSAAWWNSRPAPLPRSAHRPPPPVPRPATRPADQDKAADTADRAARLLPAQPPPLPAP